ncbi:MAG: DUF4132 domain-containing protein, partial [Sandaracinaceae bacterium]|nr:DUF4132 domain-containing protein [Sandaracinaceae bacterium]
YLAEKGHAAEVREAAARHGGEVARAIEALLSRDPLAIDRKPVKLPDFLRASDLPGVRLRGGGRLPDGARDALIELLSVAPIDPPYAGIAILREACDEGSLARFTDALCEQWVFAGAPGRHEWMLWAGVLLTPSTSARKISELARGWAQKDQAKARRACAALALIAELAQGGAPAVDLALMHLGQIAETSRFAALRAEVAAHLQAIAAARGLSMDELEERSVPDLDLDSDGTLRLSYGARTIVVSLDETGKVVLHDAEGARLRSLPRASAEDDPAAIKIAKSKLEALRKDAAQIAARQIRRLERAMVEGRAWGREDFEARFVRHPLLKHLARGLVFEAIDGERTTAIRIAEDGTLADAADDAVELGPQARVRIAHPLRLGEQLARWVALFADYEILQPFDQLGRTIPTLGAGELGKSEIDLVKGRAVPATKILGTLESRGWRRNDNGFVTAYLRDLPGGHRASLALSPGIEIANLRDAQAPALGALELTRAGRPGTFASLDRVALCELVRDLEALV